MSDVAALMENLKRPRERLATLRELEQVLRMEPSLTRFLTLAGALGNEDLSDIKAKPLRLFILRSATLEQVIPVLRARAALHGIDLRAAIGEFNQYHQEVLDPASVLYRHEPNVVILAVELADLAPELVHDYPALTPEAAQAAASRVLTTMDDVLRTLRRQTDASILVHNFETPVVAANGILDAQQPEGQAEMVRQLNRELAGLCRSLTGVYAVDYDGLVSRYGKLNWLDARLRHLAGISVNPQLLPRLADEHLRYLINLAGLTRKCLVLDMDNTLWGGVIGDDGLHGIQLGPDYPGNAFLAFHQAVLNLHRRGIILALCSKNNPENALEVLDKHPHTLLRREHFAAMQINWTDKATNVRQIASDLNIGLDSIVFLDDNPAEVAQVQEALPDVLAYRLPREPEHYAGFLQGLPVFDVLKLTDEDRARGEQYRQQSLRRSLEESCQSLEEFYTRLNMTATFSAATDGLIPRVAQLTQKTNQFNLTTRRYTEQELRANLASGAWHAYALDLDDRFGKNGWIAVGILRAETDEEMWIDTLLMSCRVMSRTVEQTFVCHLATEARKRGFRRLVGEYLPTAKNTMVAGLYDTLGFRAAEGADAGRLWSLDLAHMELQPSPYIRVELAVT
jgi:FkbH-like protein